ncbi:hypothetical protein NW762_007060 [Fusarium torreyae]|uniref:Uncharacterized protein n=1 Tax=Fusarium torreyae TaxID=1237075 RepID=A0A9W8RYR3_9HYPO|nr:hypothetical protein NW762_007060 [Fusarium torreyae]
MSSPNQSYNYGYSNSSSGSTYTGGQGTSNGYMLSQWANSQNPGERFSTTGQKSGRGAMKGMDVILDFERDFNRSKRAR